LLYEENVCLFFGLGLRFCYRFLAAKVLRDLQETDPWFDHEEESFFSFPTAMQNLLN